MSFAAASLQEAIPTDALLRRRIPAWLLSLTLHLAAVLTGSLLVRGTQLPAEMDELPRPAGIVLARPAASSKPDYFVAEVKQSAAAAEVATSSQGVDPATSTEAADFPPVASS